MELSPFIGLDLACIYVMHIKWNNFWKVNGMHRFRGGFTHKGSEV